jgi:hypothetical protein
MNLATDFLVRAVTQTLQNDVLPALENKSSAAGHLRACLMLLASIEDRVRSEGTVLFDTNTRLRDTFGRISASPVMSLEPELAQDVKQTLAAFPARNAFVSVPELFRENQAYQELLCRIIDWAHVRRDTWKPAAYADISREVAVCVAAIGKLDETLIQHARDFTPV